MNLYPLINLTSPPHVTPRAIADFFEFQFHEIARVRGRRRDAMIIEERIEVGLPNPGAFRCFVERDIGEFPKSRDDRRLLKSATMSVPPISNRRVRTRTHGGVGGGGG